MNSGRLAHRLQRRGPEGSPRSTRREGVKSGCGRTTLARSPGSVSPVLVARGQAGCASGQEHRTPAVPRVNFPHRVTVNLLNGGNLAGGGREGVHNSQ